MKTKRLFIAVPIEKKWEKIFEKYRDPLGEIRWLKSEPLAKLHVTVLFLGATNEELIPEIGDALTDVTLAQPPFTLTLEKMTYAPPEGKASMVWAKWKQQPEFATLVARVREELSYIVGPIDMLPIAPHTTIARFDKKTAPPKELIHLKHTLHEGEEMTVNEIILMESVMTPTGTIFKKLEHFKLNTGVESENIQ